MSVLVGVQYTGGTSWVHWEISWLMWVYGNPVYCTSSCVLVISFTLILLSPQCTLGISPLYWTWDWIPPVYSGYLPGVLMISPWCTEHPAPSVYSMSDLGTVSFGTMHTPRCTLHRHYAGWLHDLWLWRLCNCVGVFRPAVLNREIVIFWHMYWKI